MSQCTMRKGIIFGILIGVSLLSVPVFASAEEVEQAARQRVELSLRSWMFTNGETKWSHDASGLDSRLGNPTSKLTYKDNNTQIMELGAKINLSRRWFLRGDVGFSVDFDRGKMTDDDYLSTGGQHLYSRTNSDTTGHGTWYLNLDGGQRVAEFSGNRGYLDVFGGFQYWRTKYEARSVRQEVCNPSGAFTCSAAGTVSNLGALAIVNTTHWITPFRAGIQTEYRLTRWFSLEGKLAASPISIVYNEDRHELRADLQRPSFTMWGLGMSANADAGMKFMLARNVALTMGYRVWWNRTFTGTWENHPVGSASESAPLREFQTIRHGATIGLTAAF
ncbi:omptin family outer membrane protease [Nitrospira lenta]|uniref:Protochlamydia outer membrane protein domain-containing protein n=1 Tax=Nitrospira lenta TaxID=1436998 RepID=A0A330L6W3_9BACT|nr:omptin family outer membrane protease [Nitrospira lenta]SPP65458.1 conserved exported hypothetical protein [Nitrospira lenta]